MGDSREIGLRVGAAANQAATVVAQMGHLDVATIISTHDILLSGFLSNMEAASEMLTNAQSVPSVPSTPQAIAPERFVPAPQPAQQAMEQAFGGTTLVATDTPTITTEKRPFDINDPGVPEWLKAQAQAFGVYKLWDNTTSPKYVAAINEGKERTPPPYRSATDGVDKGFWPPNR